MKKYIRLAAGLFVFVSLTLMSVQYSARPAHADAFVPFLVAPTTDGGCACVGVGSKGVMSYDFW